MICEGVCARARRLRSGWESMIAVNALLLAVGTRHLRAMTNNGTDRQKPYTEASRAVRAMRTIPYGVLARSREVILENAPQARGSAPGVLESCRASQDSFQADAAPVSGLPAHPRALKPTLTLAGK